MDKKVKTGKIKVSALKDAIASDKEFKLLKDLSEAQKKQQKEADKLRRQSQEKQLTDLEEELELRQDVVSLTQELNNLAKKNTNYSKEIIALNKKLRDDTTAVLAKRKNLVHADKIDLEITKMIVESRQEIFDGSGKLYKKEIMLAELKRRLEEKNIKLWSKGAIEALANAEKLFEETENLSNLYVKNLDKINEINEIYDEANDTIKDMKKNTVGIYHTVAQLLKGYGAQAVFLATAYEKITDIGGEWLNISKTMGLTVDQMGALAGGMLDGIFSGVEPKEYMEAFQAMTKEFGALNKFSKSNVIEAGHLMTLYGVSAENAAKLVRFTEMGSGFSMDYAKALAKANDVPIGDVMNDVAQNAEYFALHAKNGGKNILQASVAARKMGLDLAAVAKISDSLLNNPMDSIEKQMQASVLLGKQIDLNGAAQLFFNGKDAEGLAEIKKQLGGIHEWEKMNRIQREAIASAVGMSAEEIQKMYASEGDQLKATNQISAAWIKITESIKLGGSSLKEWGLLLISAVGSLGSFLRNAKQIGESTGLSEVFGKFTGLFKKGKTPGAENVAAEIKPDTAENVAAEIKPDIAENVAAEIKSDIAEKVSGGATNMSKAMGKIKMSDVVQGAAAMAIMAGAMWIFAQALQVFAGNDRLWESLGAAVAGLGLLVGGMAAIGGVFKAFGTYIIAGALAITIISAALWVFGKALQEIAKGLVIMGEFINSLSGWDLGSLAGLALGLTLLAGAFGLISIAGIGLALTLPAIIGFASAVALLGAGMMMLSTGLSVITQDLTQLSAISNTLTAIGEGFGSIGIGLMKMGAGLAIVSPFLPVLGAMTALGGFTGNTTSTTTESSNSGTDKILAKLDELINAVKSGSTIEMDGIRLSRSLATKTPAKGSNAGYSTGQSVY